MENRICLDSDVLIDFLRNKKEEVDFIKKIEKEGEIATTPINMFELYYGAYKSEKSEKNLKNVNHLKERIILLNLSDSSIKKAGKLLASLEKEGTPIEFRDLLIGTIALTNNYSLKTNNKKHFKRIPDLSLID